MSRRARKSRKRSSASGRASHSRAPAVAESAVPEVEKPAAFPAPAPVAPGEPASSLLPGDPGLSHSSSVPGMESPLWVEGIKYCLDFSARMVAEYSQLAEVEKVVAEQAVLGDPEAVQQTLEDLAEVKACLWDALSNTGPIVNRLLGE